MLDKRVIITVLLALLFSASIGIYYHTLPTREIEKKFFTYKIHSSNTYQLIVAGDSRVYRGVSSKILEDSLKLSSFNLGFSSAVFEKKLYNLIEKKIDKTSNKKVIILGITPLSLMNSKNPNGHIFRINKMKKEEVIDYLYLFPLKKFFSPTNPISLYDKVILKKKPLRNYNQDFKIKEGWVASDYEKRDPYFALRSYKKTFSSRMYDKVMVQHLKAHVKMWKTQGIEVYGFIPPSSINMEELERNKSRFNDTLVIKQLLNAGAKWIRLDSIYHSYDGSHLIKKDAETLSKEIAYKIKNKLTDSIFLAHKNYFANYYPTKPIIQYHDDMEQNEHLSKLSDLALSGQKVAFLNKDHKYFSIKKIQAKSLISQKVKTVVISAFVYLQPNTVVELYYKIIRNGKPIVSAKFLSKYSIKPNKWGQLTLELNLPSDFTKGDLIKIGIHNKSEEEVLIDDININYY